MNHGDKPSCIEEAACDLCFGNLLYKRLQKLVGKDKVPIEGLLSTTIRATNNWFVQHMERFLILLMAAAMSQAREVAR